MMDPRVKTLAHNLIHYSTDLKPGEKILIEIFDNALPLAKALIEEAYAADAIPFVSLKNNQILRTILLGSSPEQLKLNALWEAERMHSMDAYIGIRASENASEMSDVPQLQIQSFQQNWSKPVHSDIRVPHTKWCILRYPTASMAQLANMSQEAFTDFYFKVCNLDYAKMAAAMDPLIKLMQATDRVEIVGPGTNLMFSIKGIPAVKCSGLRNIPDGEVYTAPVLHSVDGNITFNTPAVYQGITYENIYFRFENGKIVEATANHTQKLNEVLDIDNSARYIGEFSFGLNPHIHAPMKDTLFDEKINGSFHFTPGSAYKEADNGNRSAIHWDLVTIQRPEYGGGEIWFDDRLIRKDGRFVIPELENLNPEHLI